MWITGEVRRAIVVHMFDVGVFGLIVSLLGWPCRYFSGAHLRLGRGVASLRGVSAGRLSGAFYWLDRGFVLLGWLSGAFHRSARGFALLRVVSVR